MATSVADKIKIRNQTILSKYKNPIVPYRKAGTRTNKYGSAVKQAES